MRERAEQILKIVCFALAALLLAQVVRVSLRLNPLHGVAMPDVPSLPADTNAMAMAKVANKAVVKPGTNAPASAVDLKTNASPASADTNIVSPSKLKNGEGNSAPDQVMAVVSPTNSPGTNVSAMAIADTNVPATNILAGTNFPASQSTRTNNTNAVLAKMAGAKKSGAMSPLMMGPMGGKAASLPPDIQARVDRVTDSEILAPVVRPMPMALLGIAGNVAFLRSPSGQTGLVKEGDDLGEIKLLRIGTNRVLIEQDGQKKELMIFSGFGGESLLPKPTDASDETTKK